MSTNTAVTSTLRTVSAPGAMLDTQAVANAIGRNWQFVNRQRHAGKFIDPSAKLKGTGAYLYRPSVVKKWAKENGYPFMAA